MDFENSFTVNAPLQRVWEFLLDVQAVAPCMPGAKLTEIVSETEYKGTVKIKLGAVTVSYKGTATLSTVDEESHTVVLVASGRETRGTGNASSTTTSHLVEDGVGRTTVQLHSQIDVSGPVAQFGRSIMQDVATRLIGEFAANLEARLMVEGRGATEGVVPDPQINTFLPRDDTMEQGIPALEPTVEAPAAPVSNPPPAPFVGPEPQPIKVLPILAGVARTQVARGLRKLASVVEPKVGR